MRLVDLTGRVFGDLEVIRRAPNSGRNIKWLCVCACGNQPEPIGSNLVRGLSKSCGCKDRIGSHGCAIHGNRTPEYESWRAMVDRCTQESSAQWHNYGGRGISICPEWRKSFERFLADMGPRPIGHSLDRHPDVNGNYEPGNCRWASALEQGRNRRPRDQWTPREKRAMGRAGKTQLRRVK